MLTLAHRTTGYSHLKGSGLEIGALHEPAQLPPDVRVVYLDAIDETEAHSLFPEIPPERFVPVTHRANLDVDGLLQFPDGHFDFVIINHVLEHLANPIRAVAEVFRVVAPGGHAVIAIPDKDYTFDRHRQLTPLPHFWEDYRLQTTESDDAHFEDFLRSAAPHVFTEPPENLPIHIARARSRREHAHVWTSASFQAFLASVLQALSISAVPVFEHSADLNHIEYFSVWRKS